MQLFDNDDDKYSEDDKYNIMGDDDDDLDVSELLPDRIPQWVLEMSAREELNKGQMSLLGNYYAETNTVRSDKFDKKMYKQILDSVEDLNEIANSKWNEKPTWFDLVQDEFHSFYKAQPELRRPNEMKATHKINHAAMDKAKSSKEWEELRSYTQLDKWAASAAAISFAAKLGDIFEELEELNEAQKKMDKADGELGEAIGNMDASEDPDEFLDQLREALNNYGEASKEVSDAIKQNESQIRGAAKQALKEASGEANNAEALLASFGTDAGELQRMDAEERMALASRIRKSQKLRELAEKVGRHVRLAMGEQARKLNHAPDELHTIETGSNLNRVIPSELVYLTMPETEDVFYQKFVEGQLLQYKLRGFDKVGRGAIICMIDSSGSMMGARETWAKAVAIAMLNIAHRQGRDFYAIIFSSAHDPLMEWYWPKGKAKASEVLDMAEFEYRGGTDFETPLRRGVEVLTEQYRSDMLKRGDILFITDGDGHVSDPFLKEYFEKKDEMAFRTYSCLIGVNATILNRISDETNIITDLMGGTNVQNMYGMV